MQRLIRAAAAFAVVFVLPALAWAQEVATDEPINPILAAILALVATLMGAILTGYRMFVDWSKKKAQEIENEWIRGALSRFLDEAHTFGNTVGTAAEHAILNARSPTSPGGAAIVQSELPIISQAILDAMAKGYGGWTQMFGVLKRIGFGSTGDEAKKVALAKIEGIVASKLATEEKAARRGP